MWSPRTWSELEELLGIAEETPSLEFKRQIGKDTAEVAKDIAAMTVNGGVIIYGLDEDKRTQLATEIVVMPLRGVEERLHSIAGMKIAPVPAFDVTFIRENPEDSEGAVVVTVPLSTLAPHCVEGRFPCREGTTTRNLTEPEIARFYELRRTSAGERPNPGQLPGGFVQSMRLVRIDAGGAEQLLTIGEGRLLVRPLARESIDLPGGAWQSENLTSAVRCARERTNTLFANPTLTPVFNRLRDWVALDAYGWRSGDRSESANTLRGVTAVAAIMSYPGALSFHLAWGLDVHLQQWSPESQIVRIARELDVIRDVIACLAIAGEFFADVSGAGVMVAGLMLRGFDDAKSETSIDQANAAPIGARALPSAPAAIEASTVSPALDLRDEPQTAARALIERWLPPFYRDVHGRDAFDRVVPSVGGPPDDLPVQ